MARAKNTEQTTEPKMVIVIPVYGPMHHPFQEIAIDGATPVVRDNWVEVQIEAGKLTVQAP